MSKDKARMLEVSALARALMVSGGANLISAMIDRRIAEAVAPLNAMAQTPFFIVPPSTKPGQITPASEPAALCRAGSDPSVTDLTERLAETELSRGKLLLRVEELKARLSQRETELLEANNRLTERARRAERRCEKLRDALWLIADGRVRCTRDSLPAREMAQQIAAHALSTDKCASQVGDADLAQSVVDAGPAGDVARHMSEPHNEI